MRALASLSVLVAAALVLCVARPTRAAPNAAAQACRSDFTKYCSGVEPGGGRIVTCLQQHHDELTPACKSTVDQLAGCGEEVRKICGTASGRSELQECIKAHSSRFSATCRAAAPQR